MYVLQCDNMILNRNDKFAIILKSIRSYNSDSDIYTIITEEACNKMITSINTTVDTQQIYDEIVDCFNLYNDFVREKEMDLPLIAAEAYDLVRAYLNDLLGELE